MEFVSEDIIDQVIDELEALDEDQYEAKMEAFAEAQPVIVSWLFGDHFEELLSEEEQGYLEYLALIAWLAIEKVGGAREAVSEEMIGAAEEANYEIMESTVGKGFRDRLTPFFDNSDQEDLLAFAEEAVMEEEGESDALVSKEGREPIFVALKTLVDVLTK